MEPSAATSSVGSGEPLTILSICSHCNCLRSEISVWVPIMRNALPLASRSMTKPRVRIQRQPSPKRTRCSLLKRSLKLSRCVCKSAISFGLSSGWIVVSHSRKLLRLSCSLKFRISMQRGDKNTLPLVRSQSQTPSPPLSSANFQRRSLSLINFSAALRSLMSVEMPHTA